MHANYKAQRWKKKRERERAAPKHSLLTVLVIVSPIVGGHHSGFTVVLIAALAGAALAAGVHEDADTHLVSLGKLRQRPEDGNFKLPQSPS